MTIVSLPLVVDDGLYNCPTPCSGRAHSWCCPQSVLAQLQRVFTKPAGSPLASRPATKRFGCQAGTVPFGTDLLFDAGEALPGLVVGVEICEETCGCRCRPVPVRLWPGRPLLINLSASGEVIGKASYRQRLVENQSGRCLAAYLSILLAACMNRPPISFSAAIVWSRKTACSWPESARLPA